MAQYGLVNLANWNDPFQVAQGTALSASASTATVSPQAAGGQDFVLPVQSNGLQWYKGLKYKIEASGTIGSGGTASNLTVFLAAGASGTLATTLATTAAIALGTGSLSGLEWYLLATLKCTAIGSTGNTLATEGGLNIQTSTAALAIGTANTTWAPLPYTATAFNTYTQSTALGLRATLSAAFGSIQCNSFDIYQAD